MAQPAESNVSILGEDLHQVVQYEVRLQVQEALRQLQQQLTERDDAISTLQLQMHHLLQERDEAIRILERTLGERMQRLEERMALVDGRGGSEQSRGQGASGQLERVNLVAGREGSEQSGGQGASDQLEARLGKLEAAVQKALSTMFPRVEALVAQLEGTSGTLPSASSALGATAAGGAAAGAQKVPVTNDEERIRQLVQLRIKEVEAMSGPARANPLYLGNLLGRAISEMTLNDFRRFLDAGADVNARSKDGTTPLHWAVYRDTNSRDAVAMLLDRGADVNAIDVKGKSALHFVAWKGHSHVVAQLVAAGAEVDARDKNGSTPLHWAAGKNREACVRALLECGARKDLVSWSGWSMGLTPFNVALSIESQALQNLLRL